VKQSKTQISVLVAEFKRHLERLGYSRSSLGMLPACVSEFLEQLEEKAIYELWQITTEHIRQHYEYLGERPNQRRGGGLSSRMITHHIYAIRLFLNYQEQVGNIRENPISGLSFPGPGSREREVLTIEEMKQLYEKTETWQERAILGLFYGCGLRRSEGEALNIKDISPGKALVYVRSGKGGKRRVVPVSGQVLEDFKNYLHHERFRDISLTLNPNTKLNPTPNPYLPPTPNLSPNPFPLGEGRDGAPFIINKAGRRMRGETLNARVKTLVEKAGIQKEISLHNLRHSIATHLLENGMSVEYVRDFLGHKYLETTQIYTRVSKKKLYSL
jgi:integrase/recombinase XerD